MEKCSGVRMMALAMVHSGVSVGVGALVIVAAGLARYHRTSPARCTGCLLSPLNSHHLRITRTHIFHSDVCICIGHRRVSTHKSVDVINLVPSCSSLRLLFGTIVSIFFFAFYPFLSMYRLRLLYLSISRTKKENK